MDKLTKVKARSAVYLALKRRILTRKPCKVCGSLNVHAHHYKGYEKENWLEVEWLCAKHHREIENGGKTVDKEEVVKLFKKGISKRAISIKVGCQRSYVQKIIKQQV